MPTDNVNRALQSQRDCDLSAQGCEERATLGTSPQDHRYPERVGSIPYVPLVEFNFVTAQRARNSSWNEKEDFSNRERR